MVKNGREQSKNTLCGIVPENVSVTQFQLFQHHYANGPNRFESLTYNHGMPSGVDLKDPYETMGWACGIYAIYHALLLKNFMVSLADVLAVAAGNGANPLVGTDDNAMKGILSSFGAQVCALTAHSTTEIAQYVGQGDVAMLYVTQTNPEISNYNPPQDADGHWCIVPPHGVDRYGNMLVFDSGVRRVVPYGQTCWPFVLTPEGYQRIRHSFEGRLSGDETVVLGPSTWHSGTGHIVRFPQSLPYAL